MVDDGDTRNRVSGEEGRKGNEGGWRGVVHTSNASERRYPSHGAVEPLVLYTPLSHVRAQSHCMPNVYDRSTAYYVVLRL